MSMSVALTLKEQKKKKRKLFHFIVLILLFIAIILSSFVYLFYNSKKNNDESALKNILSSLIIDINSNLDYNFNTLNIMSNLVTDNPDLTALENIKTLLSNIKRSHQFKTVSYLYSNAMGYTYDYSTKNLTAADFNSDSCFWASNGGAFCFRYNFENNTYVFSVPVKSSDGTVNGVISASVSYSYISSFLNKFYEKYKYDLFLVTPDGYIVAKKVLSGTGSIVPSVFDWHYSILKSTTDTIFNPGISPKILSKWFYDSSIGRSFMAVGSLNYGDYRIILVLPGKANTNDFQKTTNDVSVSGDSVKININKEGIFKVVLVSVCALLLLSLFVFSGIRLYNLISKKSYKTVMKWALYDEVTDGFNKPKFYLEVSNILLNSQPEDKFALIFMDIHNFKVINQVYDSIKGNDILKDVAESIKWFLEKDGISARIMSDNFAILYKYRHEDRILNFINNLTRAIGEYKLSVKLIPVFGIFKITDFTMPVETMVDRAIMAKKTLNDDFDFSSNYAFFTKELIDKVEQAKEIENEMYFALNQGQFIFYLQPQFDISTKKIIGAEALVRWNHPHRGIQLPAKFLYLFEKKSFITYLDQYVVEQVCKLISKWISANIEPLPISVNLSGLNLVNPRFADMMNSMAEMYKIPANLINFEFDESSVFENSKYVKNILAALQAYGFNVSLDNFGKVYSAVNVLNDFTFDSVKFNMNFIKALISNERGKNILNELNKLVKSIDTKSVAVGIETDYEANLINNFNIDVVQGFLYSRPLCVTDFEIFVFKKNITSIYNEDIKNG